MDQLYSRMAHRGTPDSHARRTETSMAQVDEGHSPAMHRLHLDAAAQLVGNCDAETVHLEAARYLANPPTP